MVKMSSYWLHPPVTSVMYIHLIPKKTITLLQQTEDSVVYFYIFILSMLILILCLLTCVIL